MARETAQQKAERRAREEAAARAALEAYVESVPKRLMEAQALASTLFVNTSVGLSENGPTVHFEYESDKYKIYIDNELNYQTEQWELEMLEDQLHRLKVAIDDEKLRYEAAKVAWAGLSESQHKLIKEFIYLLK